MIYRHTQQTEIAHHLTITKPDNTYQLLTAQEIDLINFAEKPKNLI